MKTCITALLLALLVAHPTEAAIASVSVATARSTGGAEMTTVASQTTTGATLLTAVCGVYVALGATYSTVSDSKGNTWHYGTGVNGLSYGIRIAYAYDHGGTALSVGSSHTFSTTNNGNASYPACVFRSWSGTDTTSAVFVGAGTQATTSASPTLAPGAITPAVGDLLLTGHSQNTDSATTANSGFSATTEIGPSASNSVYAGDSYLLVVSAVSTNPTWTSATTGEQDVAMAEFLAGSGGGATIPHGLPVLGIGD